MTNERSDDRLELHRRFVERVAEIQRVLGGCSESVKCSCRQCWAQRELGALLAHYRPLLLPSSSPSAGTALESIPGEKTASRRGAESAEGTSA